MLTEDRLRMTYDLPSKQEVGQFMDLLEKGKAAPIGDVRTWSGRQYVKHADGWVNVHPVTSNVTVLPMTGPIRKLDGNDEHKAHYEMHVNPSSSENGLTKEQHLEMANYHDQEVHKYAKLHNEAAKVENDATDKSDFLGAIKAKQIKNAAAEEFVKHSDLYKEHVRLAKPSKKADPLEAPYDTFKNYRQRDIDAANDKFNDNLNGMTSHANKSKDNSIQVLKSLGRYQETDQNSSHSDLKRQVNKALNQATGDTVNAAHEALSKNSNFNEGSNHPAGIKEPYNTFKNYQERDAEAKAEAKARAKERPTSSSENGLTKKEHLEMADYHDQEVHRYAKLHSDAAAKENEATNKSDFLGAIKAKQAKDAAANEFVKHSDLYREHVRLAKPTKAADPLEAPYDTFRNYRERDMEA